VTPAPLNYPIFGESDATTIVPYTYWGKQGFYALPLGWPLTTDANGIQWTTDPDSGKTYSCLTNIDGVVCFRDLFRTKQNE
jgi:hypothetical protein